MRIRSRRFLEGPIHRYVDVLLLVVLSLGTWHTLTMLCGDEYHRGDEYYCEGAGADVQETDINDTIVARSSDGRYCRRGGRCWRQVNALHIDVDASGAQSGRELLCKHPMGSRISLVQYPDFVLNGIYALHHVAYDELRDVGEFAGRLELTCAREQVRVGVGDFNAAARTEECLESSRERRDRSCRVLE